MIFSLSLLLLSLNSNTINAQVALSVGSSPTSKTLKLSQGEIYSDEVVFWNLSQQSETYKVFVSGFQQIENQPGTAVILTQEDDEKAPYSASQWVDISKDILELEPNKNVKLKYSVTVPQDATNGEFYAEIFLISENAYLEKGTAAFANLAVGMPILIQIGDEFVEKAELLRFVSDKKVYEKINVNFLTQLKNLGDTHITPTGEIVVTNIFRQEVTRVQFNKNTQSLLRDNLGNYQDSWIQSSYLSPNNAIAIGPMKATLLVTYRSFQPGFAVLNSETTFWIIPWKIILAILTTIALILIVRITKKKIEKKYEIS